MSLLSKIKPKQQAYELDAYFAPGHYFFCRRVEIPADLEQGEEEGFALLELENLSPFPLEHMHYGFRLDENRRFAFVFAAYRRRFEGEVVAAWRHRDAALPEFLMALHPEAHDRDPLLFVGERSIAGFRYDERSSLPCDFVAERRNDIEDESSVDIESESRAFWSRASSRLGKGRPRIWRFDTESQWLGQTAWLRGRDLATSGRIETSFERDEIWKADIRDPETVAQARKDERQNGILWKGVIGIVALIGLLALGEAVLVAGDFYLSTQMKANEEREPVMLAIESRQVTNDQLESFKESNLDPFTLIESLRPYQRYPEIIYRRFEMEGPGTLSIDARADNQSRVTQFKQRLEGFGKITSVELSNQESRGTGTTFTVTLSFDYGVFTQAPEMARNE